MNHNYNLTTIILAAGKGKRILSSSPKWSFKIGNFSLLEHVLYKAKLINSDQIIGVFAPQYKDQVENIFKDFFANNTIKSNIALQEEANGTATAVLAGKQYVENTDGVILILYCDTPLVPINTLNKLLSLINSNAAQVACIGFTPKITVDKPSGYGRFVVEEDNLKDIIEANDSKGEDKKQKNYIYNSGIIAVSARIIWDLLQQVDNNNASQEYYLTSIVKIANNMGYKCKYVFENESKFLEGVNTKEELSKLEASFQDLKRAEFLSQGVTLIDPKTIYFSLDTKIGDNVTIQPFNIILKNVTIGDNVTLESFSCIANTTIRNGAIIGPYARIYNSVVIGENVNVGNFVEIKESIVENHVKIKHLSYIGNTSIGEYTNIGAGTITCNYDGHVKNHTSIGHNTFIGSNVSLVAPITIGDHATIGAGSVITNSVTNYSLSLERNTQVEIKNWKKKIKKF